VKCDVSWLPASSYFHTFPHPLQWLSWVRSGYSGATASDSHGFPSALHAMSVNQQAA
jgi:hypothetical protein